MPFAGSGLIQAICLSDLKERESYSSGWASFIMLVNMTEMTTEDKISVVLKEYEALRKEIDVRTDATKNYGWPVIAVAFAAIVGWKPENICFKNMLRVGHVIRFCPEEQSSRKHPLGLSGISFP